MGKLIGGGGLIAVALFMLLGFFNAGPMSTPVAVFTFLLSVALPAATGGSLLRSHFRQKGNFARQREQLRLQTYESEILQLAQRKGGKLTVVEVAAETGLDAPTADAALQSLAQQGVADIEVTDSGVLVYAFYDIQKLPEKDSSRNILDA
ncbi:MAG: helix-turn-helix domain-containing protein [Gemmatimonadales bacterium]